MKRVSFVFFAVVLGAGLYAVSPLYSAWTIRAAAKAGDTAFLKDKIDWVSIRPGLKTSLTAIAIGVTRPQAASQPRPQPGLWQQVKNYSKKLFIHAFVDSYANADGFETLVTYGRSIRRSSDDERGLSLLARIERVWARVRKAKFTSLTRFELDLLDKDDPLRVYAGVLELRGFQWTVVELHIHQLAPPNIAQRALSRVAAK